MAKITFLGEPYPAPRVHRDTGGKYSRTTSRSTKFALVVLVVGIVFFGFIAPRISKQLDKAITASNPVSMIMPEKALAATTTQSNIEAMKNDVLNQLAACESGGKKEEDGITTLDTNGVGSYGEFQFQRKTVMSYYPKMTGEQINGRDAIILAMTPDKARALASYIIFDTKAGVGTDWVNCSKNHSLQVQVDLIKNNQ